MKTVAWLFFLPTHQIFKIAIWCVGLSILIALPAQAQEVSLQVPSDYKVTEVAALGNVKAFTFDFEGNYIVAEDIGAPATRKRGQIIAYRINKVLADGTVQPLLDRTGQNIINLSFYQGVPYLIIRGQVYKIAKGKISSVVTGLPTKGDYGNSSIVFVDGSMYIAVGTATNSGIVGPDNQWLGSYPSVRDIPCSATKLSGVNIETDNFLTEKKGDKANTGSFSTFNTPIPASLVVHGMTKCNGGILKISPDGALSQVYAWGFHNPKGLSVDDDGNLWVFDGGMEDRGVRPIKNGKDALYQVLEQTWYGWPDFSAGERVDQQAVIAEFANTPPKPNAVFDLNQIRYIIVSPKLFLTNSALAQVSDNKLQRLDLANQNLTDFISTKGNIIQYKFGPDDKLYVLIATEKDKSVLYSVESTNPPVSTIVGSTKSKSFAMNWIWGLMLSGLIGAGYYAVRNMRYPIKPL